VVRAGSVWVGNLRRLRLLVRGVSPSWSPDGTRIAVVRGGWVWLVRVRDGASRRLVPGGAPAWSPDGLAVAYVGARNGVDVVTVGGGRTRRVGRVRGRSVDWQPASSAPACVPPPGATVLGSSPLGVVYSTGDSAHGRISWFGCLRAVGREWLLGTGLSFYGSLEVGPAALAGRFAALRILSGGDPKDFIDSTFSVSVYDLSTGLQRYGNLDPCPGAVQIYAPCGLDSLVVNSSGFTSWHATESPASPYGPGLSGVSCPSAALCVAVDGAGNVLTATSPTGGSAAWTITNVDGPTALASVSCPSVSLCVAVDSVGRVFSSVGFAVRSGRWAPRHQQHRDIDKPDWWEQRLDRRTHGPRCLRHHHAVRHRADLRPRRSRNATDRQFRARPNRLACQPKAIRQPTDLDPRRRPAQRYGGVNHATQPNNPRKGSWSRSGVAESKHELPDHLAGRFSSLAQTERCCVTSLMRVRRSSEPGAPADANGAVRRGCAESARCRNAGRHPGRSPLGRSGAVRSGAGDC
jgi:hypothetical protein